MRVMGWWWCVFAAAILTTGAAVRPAHACGGCFNHEPPAPAPDVPPPPPSQVTAHKMALAISPTQTVLWDSVSYDGDPNEFAWVLPVGPGARLEMASDAFFEALDAVTRPRVFAPRMRCVSSTGGGGGTSGATYAEGDEDVGGGGGGCGGGGGSSSGSTRTGTASSSSGGGTTTVVTDVAPTESQVQVVHSEAVGPYEVVTLRSRQQGALVDWLQGHAYSFAPDMVPVINAFESEGADFIAMRLQPQAGVRAMRPVRVVYPQAMLSLPLRMVQAGTGAKTGVLLYLLAEGRMAVDGATNVEIPGSQVTYYFGSQRSDYVNVRSTTLQQNGGNVWLTTFSRRGALLAPLLNPITGQQEIYVANSRSAGSDYTLAQLYVSQARANGEIQDQSCKTALTQAANSNLVVVNPCSADGNCRPLADHELDARTLSCGTADDVAAALTGMHPSQVWVTRLEAELPRSALQQDLSFNAVTGWEVGRNLRAGMARDAPCQVVASAPRGGVRPPDWWPVAFAGLVLYLRRSRATK